MAETAAAMVGECGFFEFRLDTATDAAAAVAEMAGLLETHREVVTIATCRRVANGGRFAGTAVEEARVLHAAASAGAQVVDVSVETAEELQGSAPEVLNVLRHSAAALLVSWHDFAGTPDLEAVLARMERFAPDFCKVVPTATCLEDALRLMTLLRRHGGSGRLVAMSMGVCGVLTRVLGPVWGSAWTFAAPDAGSATAPGQVDFRTMREVYRVEAVSASTAVYGVFGAPIGGSKSPTMLNAAFAAARVDAVYLPLETADAGELWRVVEVLGMRGASVTMPLKELIVPGLEGRLSALAETIGAANTLVRDADGGLRGENTDAAGVVDPLASRLRLEQARVLVLGAGGAARAAVFGLRARGARVWILSRSRERAEVPARAAGAEVVTRAEAEGMRWDAVVNATPHGMWGQVSEAPMEAAEMDAGVFFDLVYNPLETPLLLAARARGMEGIAGVEMFLAQGAAQFKLWMGEDAPVEVMRGAVLRELA